MWLDQKTDFGGGYKPGNYDDRFHGPLQTRYALANSYNIPAVKQLAVVGLEDMLGTLQDFGITTLTEPSNYGLSLTLGGGAIKLYELTNAYAILGRGGETMEPQPILKVTDPNGEVLFEYKQEKGEQAVSEEKAYLINNILADKTAKYQAYGQFWADRLNFRSDIAVKTGTSENKVDNWTFGYTPNYTVGVWVGNNDNSPMHPALSSGVTGAAPIFRSVMENVLKGKKVDNFAQPSGIISMKVDSTTGQKASQYSRSTRSEFFEKSNLPPENDMYVRVEVCRPSGKIASESCRDAGQSHGRIYTVMYDPYTKQFQNGKTVCKPCAPTETDDNYYPPEGNGTDEIEVTITSPNNFGSVNEDFTATATVSGTPYDIVSVSFSVDGQEEDDSSAPYSVDFDDVDNGAQTLTVRAIDEAGNVGESSITVLVN
jgi:membrane carboxypeptidase/penicillin-binding protein PbpC